MTVFGMRSGINDSSSQSQNSRAQSVGSSFPKQGCQMRLDPLAKTIKKIKIKLWEIKMFDGGSERGRQRGPMSNLCVLAIRRCLPHESETKAV